MDRGAERARLSGATRRDAAHKAWVTRRVRYGPTGIARPRQRMSREERAAAQAGTAHSLWCTECGEWFRDDDAFNRHTLLREDRCRSVDEMLAAGLVRFGGKRQKVWRLRRCRCGRAALPKTKSAIRRCSRCLERYKRERLAADNAARRGKYSWGDRAAQALLVVGDCSVCGRRDVRLRATNPVRRCSSCQSYFYRHGVERKT